MIYPPQGTGLNPADANAVPADVLTPSTFYAGTPAKQTGTMPDSSYSSPVVPSTSQQQIAAGFHDGTGNDAVEGDANLVGANIVSGVSIFGVAGSYVATLAQDIVTSTITNLNGTVTGQSGYNYSAPIAASSTLTLVTSTNTFAADSMAVAVGYFFVYLPGTSNALKGNLYMAGVQVAQSAYIGTSQNIILVGTQVLSGSQSCVLEVQNFTASSVNLIIPGYSNNTPIAAAIGIGNIKIA